MVASSASVSNNVRVVSAVDIVESIVDKSGPILPSVRSSSGSSVAELELPSSNEASPITSSTMDLPSGLKICYCDDSVVACKLFKKVFLELLPSVHPDSGAAGVTSSEVLRFVDIAMGRCDWNGMKITDGLAKEADIVFLDQNIDCKIDHDEGKDRLLQVRYLGTDLAAELATAGFKGLVIIMSVNSTGNDVQVYLKSKGVYACIDKAAPLSERKRFLRDIYQEFSSRRNI